MTVHLPGSESALLRNPGDRKLGVFLWQLLIDQCHKGNFDELSAEH